MTRRPDLFLAAVTVFCHLENTIRGRECPVCGTRYHQLTAHLNTAHYPGESPHVRVR